MTIADDVFVHPAALCESDLVGGGTRVWAFAHVLRGAVIGRDCNICDNVFVEGGVVVGDRVTVKNNVLLWDGVTIDDDVFLGPAATFTNDLNPRAAVKKDATQLRRTRVRSGATVGANTTVVCGVTIGEGAFIGAGAVIVQDVPAYAQVLGNPGRQLGWRCACGERLLDTSWCGCGRTYERDGYGGLRRAGGASWGDVPTTSREPWPTARPIARP